MVASEIDETRSNAASLGCGVATLRSNMNLIVDNRSARSTFEYTKYGHFHRLRVLISEIAKVLIGEQFSQFRMVQRSSPDAPL
jgi:hypothetical protein